MTIGKPLTRTSGNPPALNVSIALGANEPIDRIVSLIQMAENLGVEGIWMLDSQTLYKDAYATMAVLARETERLKIGPGVTNLITRHETVIANALTTLATFAPGRITIGLGTGDSSVRSIGLKPLGLNAFRTAVERLRSLLRGEQLKYDGHDVGVSSTYQRHEVPPIFIAATQPRMLEVAGAIGDGVILLGPANPETIRLQLSHIAEGARAASRDPAEIVVDLWVGLSISEDTAAARQDLRSFASTQARIFASWNDLPASLEKFRAELTKASENYDYRQHLSMHAEHAASVSDEFVDEIAIAGSVGHCSQRLQELFEVGVNQVTATLLPGGREARLESFAELWSSL